MTPPSHLTGLLAALTLVLAGCAAPGGTPATPGTACRTASAQEIEALFDGWNDALQTGDPRQVAARYAPQSLLLPTVSDRPRRTAAEKEDYFHHFLADRPRGSIDLRVVELGCNTAVDTGLYTFTFARTNAVVRARYTFTYGWDGAQWRITSHHSSAMPGKP